MEIGGGFGRVEKENVGLVGNERRVRVRGEEAEGVVSTEDFISSIRAKFENTKNYLEELEKGRS